MIRAHEPACAGLADDTMFPDIEDTEHYEADLAMAKSICDACPADIKQKCLIWALRSKEEHGVWGGFSPEERGEMLQRLGEQVEQRKVGPRGGRVPLVAEDTVFRMVREEGRSTREVAQELGIGIRTVQRALVRAEAAA